jgi:hypothetical protein
MRHEEVRPGGLASIAWVRRTVRAARSSFLVPMAVLVAVACGPSQKNTDLRQWTDDLTFRISTDPMPPRAREKIAFKVVVQDKESRQPIEKGEGRVFATSRDGKNVWDVLEATPEPGTYRASLSFLTAGDWAVAIQFRRDSTQKLERVDWMQTVKPAVD